MSSSPVICSSVDIEPTPTQATDAGSYFFNDIANRLEGDDNPEDEESRVTETHVTHLHPSDCSTLLSAMKTLVVGFVDESLDGETTSA